MNNILTSSDRAVAYIKEALDATEDNDRFNGVVFRIGLDKLNDILTLRVSGAIRTSSGSTIGKHVLHDFETLGCCNFNSLITVMEQLAAEVVNMAEWRD